MSYLDLRELADELDELRDKRDEGVMFDEEDAERLEALESIESDLGGDLSTYAENEGTAIPESDFEDYCQELAEGCGFISDRSNPLNPLMGYIDWERWANDCKHDYSSFYFEGESYYVRSY